MSGEGVVAVPARVRAAALDAFGGPRPAGSGAGRAPIYVYDLPGLTEHVTGIRAALPDIELFYAAKANPDSELLRTLGPQIDGVEVSSGGELEHVRRTLPGARLAFGGPGKTDHELDLALRLGVDRIHVESPYELRRLAALAAERRVSVDILLRAGPAIPVRGAALTMNGPFGMDEAALDECARILTADGSAAGPRSGSGPGPGPGSGPSNGALRLRGVHLHVASGLDRTAMLALAERILTWARRSRPALAPAVAGGREAGLEINLGGGMGVDYGSPGGRFDWAGYGRGLAALRAPGEILRIEPGRAVTAYHGWYVTEVLDVKRNRGEWFAVLRGGTHHLRTPVTKGHDQPFAVLPIRPDQGAAVRAEAVGTAGAGGAISAAEVPSLTDTNATLVGQLCTPKDVFAHRVWIRELRAGDLVAFALAGAYAWNISHHDFLMHPKPRFHYVGDGADISE